ncbi:MAG: cellulase family glycosylhydrolase [Ruminiclostridium sp.]|nr:cellulase family glycosylhydrolase [Ruminiclostridium sp.]
MKKLIRKTLALITAAVLAVTAAVVPASAENITLGKNEAMTFVDSMGAGWNLGNAFDAANCTWVGNELDYESAWCGAKTTKELIKAVKNAGFNTIRVPVSYHDHIDKDLNISEVWMARVKEVIDWCLAEDLYVITNVHHDVEKGYYYPSSAEYSTSSKYMKKIWEQICDTFKNYDEKLIFETINEPRLTGTNFEWWYNVGNPEAEVADSLDCINKLNQVAVDTIRKSGGKNASRYILVGGYDTDGTTKGILSPKFVMPTDTAKNRLIADVHFYGIGEGAGHTLLDDLYKAFTSKGTPVVLTEYGLNSDGYKYLDNTDAAVKRMTDFASYARARGISAVFWDNNYIKQGEKGHKLIDRATAKVICPEITKAFTEANKPAGLKSGSSSSSSSSTTTTTAAKTVSIKAKAAVGKTSIKLSWDKVDGATKYAVYMYKDGKYKCVSSKVTATSYTVKKLRSGTKYKFYVRAYVDGKWTKTSQSKVTTATTKKK